MARMNALFVKPTLWNYLCEAAREWWHTWHAKNAPMKRNARHIYVMSPLTALQLWDPVTGQLGPGSFVERQVSTAQSDPGTRPSPEMTKIRRGQDSSAPRGGQASSELVAGASQSPQGQSHLWVSCPRCAAQIFLYLARPSDIQRSTHMPEAD